MDTGIVEDSLPPATARLDLGAITCFALLGGLLLIPRVFQYDLVVLYPLLLAAWVSVGSSVNGYRAVIATLLVLWLGDLGSVLAVPFLTLVMLAWAIWLGRRLVSLPATS
jgi:hypothetical protein